MAQSINTMHVCVCVCVCVHCANFQQKICNRKKICIYLQREREDGDGSRGDHVALTSKMADVNTSGHVWSLGDCARFERDNGCSSADSTCSFKAHTMANSETEHTECSR